MVDVPLRIVIAEDDFFVCEQIKRILRGSRYQVAGEARNGEEAVRMALDLRPDLILMDIKMPKMDGLAASRRITDEHPLPIVILSAYESAELVRQASEVGVGAFLNKPPQFTEIDRAITIALARHQDLMAMRRLNEKLGKALEEIKILKGILPICAQCKKIRNDEGYWEQVDHYLSERTGAVFSHGLCKECSDAMYGGQEWYEGIESEEK